jgi:hypothetical protein
MVQRSVSVNVDRCVVNPANVHGHSTSDDRQPLVDVAIDSVDFRAEFPLRKYPP